MKEHIVKSFDSQLDQLSRKMENLSTACLLQLTASSQSFETRDCHLARQIIKKDHDINQMHQDIEAFCVKFLSLRQPVANDLRYLLSSMKISAELERIGDYSANVAKRVEKMSGPLPKEPVTLILEMASVCNAMVKKAMDAFFTNNVQNAIDAWNMDDDIDQRYASMLVLVRQQMQGEKDMVENGTQLIFIGRCFERIGDHITNIAEDIYFMVTGQNFMDRGEDQAPQDS